MKRRKRLVGFRHFLMAFCCLFLIDTTVPTLLMKFHEFAIENSDVDEKESEEKNEELKEKLKIETLFAYEWSIVWQYDQKAWAKGLCILSSSQNVLSVPTPPPDHFSLV